MAIRLNKSVKIRSLLSLIFISFKQIFFLSKVTALLLILSSLNFSLVESGPDSSYVYPFSSSSCGPNKCFHGLCVNSTNGLCVCEPGWGGVNCNQCKGRVKYVTARQGFITDGYGNYTLDNKCTWLIQGPRNSTIRLRIDKFATECGWDHVYIYDGNSVYAPLIAVLSGLLVPEKKSEFLGELVAQSGSAYVHFYSDQAYNMSGFNISYRMQSCPQDCSGHGQCTPDFKCVCNDLWRGDACNTPICPSNCNKALGYGTCVTHSTEIPFCRCSDGYRGADCGTASHNGVWTQLETLPEQSIGKPLARASHVSVIEDGFLWAIDGYTFESQQNSQAVIRYDFIKKLWVTIPNSRLDLSPLSRFDHSVVAYQGMLYMYGGNVDGTISNELWAYSTKSNYWQLISGGIKNSLLLSKPWPVAGHTAHIVNGVMFIIFGHSPKFGYLNVVQTCNMSNFVWDIPKTRGALVQMSYGHSSVYDPYTRLIYVHGGYRSTSTSTQSLVDSLYSFNPKTGFWKILKNCGQYKYLHSATIIDGVMLVFGGNPHNDTAVSCGAKCYSADFMAYDIKCDYWYKLTSPQLHYDISRFGHTATIYNSSMYVFAGFNGVMLHDLLLYQPGVCQSFKTSADCLLARSGVVCVWVSTHHKCLPRSEALNLHTNHLDIDKAQCQNQVTDSFSMCTTFTSCYSCVVNTHQCVWCGNKCVTVCNDQGNSALNIKQCLEISPRDKDVCHSITNCQLCTATPNCLWSTAPKPGCQYILPGSVRLVSKSEVCKSPCFTYNTCENCTRQMCLWCSSSNQCVESNSYVPSFPYGRCREWTTTYSKCPKTRCSDIQSCSECQNSAQCGWCNDVSDTGLGVCMEGGADGPRTASGSSARTPSASCPRKRWFFSNCPKCQCNGHSTCAPGSNKCSNCTNLTTGDHCELCKPGYWGPVINGGNCTACSCNGQADYCNPKTGVCYCRTKGVIGDHCEQCDELHKYFGNPKNGGSCLYDLLTDYQFTFNLSKESDRHYTQIHFINIPHASDQDVEFHINCSGPSFLNISLRTNSNPTGTNLEFRPCIFYRRRFKASDLEIAAENVTFLVYVYNFTTPFRLQISFSQFNQIDLVHFFITFFSCFLSLLLVAAIFWKVRQRCQRYRARQQQFVQMEQMASRPFSTCHLDLSHSESSMCYKAQPPEAQILGKKKTSTFPSPIAVEPLSNKKSAIVSFVIYLPVGDDEFTPTGQSGLSICSALVTTGHNRQSSSDFNKSDKVKAKKGSNIGAAEHCI